jgi:ferric iron reductase protein FhuF
MDDRSGALMGRPTPPAAPIRVEPPDWPLSLARTLARLRQIDDRLDVTLGQPTGPDWVPAQALCEPGPPLRECIERYAEHLGATDLRVGASLFLKRYTFLVAIGVLAGYVSNRCVPDSSACGVSVQLNAGIPSAVAFTCAALATVGPRVDESGTITLEAPEPLLAWTCERLLALHLFVVASASRRLVKLNERMLRTNVAAMIMWSFRYLARAAESPVEHDRCIDDAAAFFAAVEAFRDCGRLVLLDDGSERRLGYERKTCCLKFLLPGRRLCEECSLPRRPESCG